MANAIIEFIKSDPTCPTCVECMKYPFDWWIRGLLLLLLGIVIILNFKKNEKINRLNRKITNLKKKVRQNGSK